MSLKFFYAPGACSFVPHSMLELAGAEFEPVMVKLHKGEQNSDEYLALNPRGQVPVLVDDGEVVTQIVAILLHLDAKFPQAGILPAAGLARRTGRAAVPRRADRQDPREQRVHEVRGARPRPP